MARQKVGDPKRNAGVSLTGAEMGKLEEFAKAVKLEGKSAVVSMLIDKYLPAAWWNLDREGAPQPAIASLKDFLREGRVLEQD